MSRCGFPSTATSPPIAPRRGAGEQGAPPLPEQYWRTHDQFVALAAAAAVTTTLKLGTGITLVAQRDPIWLAKEVASLDMISGGRLLFGIGYGWNKEEMAHHGVQYAERRAVVREKILAMKELWTKDEAAFAGDHVNFSSSWSWPKPTTKPHPPVILGSSGGPKTFQHIIEFCDGWMPIASRTPVLEQVTHLRRASEDAGRDPASIELGVFQIRPEVKYVDPLIEAGFARALFGLPQGEPAEVAEHLEFLAEFVQQYR